MLERTNNKKTLPHNWCWVKHEEIAAINPKLDSDKISDKLDVSFLPMAAVEEKTGRFSLTETRLFGKVKKGYTQFKNGDLLFAKITPCMENGKVAVVENLKNGIGCGSTEFHVSRPVDLVERKYLFFYFVQEAFRREAQRNMTGSAGQLRVPKPFFAEAQIPLPPIAEQQRIVDKIEELFSDLDSGINSLKTAQQQLKVYRQAVLKWAFEGKLTAQWREEQQRQGKLASADTLLAQIKTEREQRYQKELEAWQSEVEAWEAIGKEGKKPRKPSKPKKVSPLTSTDLQELPKIPAFWFWTKLGYLTLGVEYGTSAKSQKKGGIPVLRMGNIQNCKFDWSDLVFTSNDEEINQYILRKGDILFNRTNSPELVGKTAIYRGERPAIFAGYLIRVNHFHNFVESKYLNYFLSSVIASNHGNKVKTDGVNQSNINGQKLMDYPFPYTHLEEQIKIVEEIESRLSICDQLEADIEANLKKAEALRQSILKQAFTGKLVSQDPNDEPAAVLLDRIRAEHEAHKARGNTGNRAKASSKQLSIKGVQ